MGAGVDEGCKHPAGSAEAPVFPGGAYTAHNRKRPVLQKQNRSFYRV